MTNLLGVPGASTPTAMTYDSARGYMVLVTPTANASASGSQTVGTWAYANGSWSELTTRSAPSSREYSSLVFDGSTRQVLLFGGYSPAGTYLSDTWGFDGSSWTNLTSASTAVPAARADANLAFDSADGSVVMFGGYGATGLLSTGTLSDTWLYSSGNWTKVSTTAAPPPSGAMAYDANASTVVYYGGVGLLGTCTGSTFEFNGKDWADVSSSVTGSPGALALESMTYDPEYGGVVAYGGVCGVGIAGVSLTLSDSNSTWGLSGGHWSELSASQAPAATYGGNLAFDPQTSALLLFGGVHPSLISAGKVQQDLSGTTWVCANDTWARLGPTLSSSRSLAETGMNVTVHVADAVLSGPTAFNYTGLPGSCSGVSGPSVTCLATATGNFTMHVNVTATLGLPGSPLSVTNLTASLGIRIVAGLKMAPIAASLPKTEVGVPISFTASVTDGVNVSQLQYSGLPTGCGVPTALSVQCTPTSSGSFLVSLTALDALGVQATESLPIVVAPRASMASFTLSREVVDVGMNTSAAAVVQGGVGPFGVGFTGLPNGCLSSDALTITCRPTAVGTFGVSVIVTDSLKVVASSTATLTVNPLPAIRSVTLSDPVVRIGGSSTISVNLIGGTAPYRISYSGLPAGCGSANATALLCAPSVRGNFTIVVTATDSVGVTAVGTANLTVEAAPTQIHPGAPAGGLPPFAEGLASGAALFAIVVSAFLVRSGLRASEGRGLADELERGVATEGQGLDDEASPLDPK
ncbi:MAG TPA: kelch repeat-containing protein [Thermoplasmata archaeon]|nr:kelch repeat-containing protein [Thermoplasmata archaeon]